MNPRTGFFLFLLAFSAWAHPMGNFSISHYSRFEPQPNGLELTYALDLAEVPAFQLLEDWKLNRSSPREQLEARALEQARAWAGNLALTVNGSPVEARVQSAELLIADGAGNVPVLRITARILIAASPGKLIYADNNYPDRAGWKEIVIAAGSGVELQKASHSAKDLSKALSAYPEDPAVAPPQDLRAQLEWRVLPLDQPSPRPAVIEPVEQPRPVIPPAESQSSPGAPVTQSGVVQKGDSLSKLLGRQDLGVSGILLALVAAFGFGAAHALSPGHGKTIVAAYLVGSRGTFKHAIFLGAMVTFTHTVSVFLLGLGTLFLSQYVVPDKVYPVLGAISGLMIVIIGGSLFYKRLLRLATPAQLHHTHDHTHDHHHHDHGHTHTHEHKPALVHAHAQPGHAHPHHDHAHDHHHDHDHGHAHDHHHHDDHGHHHGPGGHSHTPEGEVTFGSLVGLAVSGGMVPCPSALVLLLSSIALGRVGLGLLLLTSFSLGLSLVLIAIGCIVLYAKHLLPATPKVTGSPLFRMVPVLSAGVITVVGIVMTAVALGVVKAPWLV